MPADIEHIRAWRDKIAKEAAANGEKMFMGKPEAWFEDIHWFCPNGHVSGMFLKADRGDLCMACQEPVLMGPAIGEAEFKPILEELDRIKVVLRSSKSEMDGLSQ